MFFKKKEVIPQAQLLGELLGQDSLREEFLGAKLPRQPSPNQLLNDTANYVKYTQSAEYKVWAKEAWAQVLYEFDTILDPKSTVDQVNNARGAARATLDLLRKSYHARQTYDSLANTSSHQNVPSAR